MARASTCATRSAQSLLSLEGPMRVSHLHFAFSLAACATLPRPMQAQTCWTEPNQVSLNVAFVQRIVSDTGARAVDFRATAQLPTAAVTTVQIVTDEAICSQLLASHRVQRGSSAVASIMAIRVGAARYVVFDGQTRVGEYAQYDVYDAGFAWLAAFVG